MSPLASLAEKRSDSHSLGWQIHALLAEFFRPRKEHVRRLRSKVEVDNIPWDLQNSPYPKEAEFNNCSFKILSSLKIVNLLAATSLFDK